MADYRAGKLALGWDRFVRFRLAIPCKDLGLGRSCQWREQALALHVPLAPRRNCCAPWGRVRIFLSSTVESLQA